ncbi:protein translocase subunit SecF [Rhabdothermincola sediminis]|uniref:protein translocase subunit SecF n=1 Tax=Rhabdothermincola sediminis TaxID=2751370 RepID=UPI001AA080CD|nr:protein translocase subunit SecF [Rhabdothermincola sediminis]
MSGAGGGLARLMRGETQIDFRRWWARGLVFSAVLLVASLGSLLTRGLNLGIDFKGGVSFELPAPGVSVAAARDALDGVGQAGAKIQVVGDGTLRVQGPTESPEKSAETRQVLADLAGVNPSEVNVSEVGPSWGDEITRSAMRALVIFLVAILVYLSLRLEWPMALGALAAVTHDVLVSVGVYSIFQFELTPATVIAFLTILGYSIYDTIVVFDKVKENEGRVGLSGRMTYTEMVSLSMNQVMPRSLNTTITSIMPVISILVVGAWWLGAVTLQEFGLALFVGLLAGAYSSIFVAAPTLVAIKERQQRYRSIRERVLASRASSRSPVEGEPPAAPEAASTATRAPSSPGRPAGASAVTYSGAIPPRPRKKGKRR